MFFTGSPTKQGLLYKQSYINSLRAHAQGSVPCYYYYSIFKDMIRPCPWEEKKTFVETFKAEDGPRPRHCLAAGSPPTYITTHDGKFAWKNLLPRFLMAKQFLYHQISKRLMQVKNLHIHEYIQLNLKIKKKKKKTRQIHQELTLALQLQYMPGSLHLLMFQMTPMSPHKTGLCRVL